MSNTCATCEELQKALAEKTVAHVRADAERKAFLPEEPFSAEDAKRTEELRLAAEKAKQRLEEATQHLFNHRRAAGH
jgi:hypothetical protein